ncbi:hypothetical protein Pelo_11783 [Pelomyxa schiedti]|nr:hypothetical protein Pelo_11783 [Pelomyxa schiedti]
MGDTGCVAPGDLGKPADGNKGVRRDKRDGRVRHEAAKRPPPTLTALYDDVVDPMEDVASATVVSSLPPSVLVHPAVETKLEQQEEPTSDVEKPLQQNNTQLPQKQRRRQDRPHKHHPTTLPGDIRAPSRESVSILESIHPPSLLPLELPTSTTMDEILDAAFNQEQSNKPLDTNFDTTEKPLLTSDPIPLPLVDPTDPTTPLPLTSSLPLTVTNNETAAPQLPAIDIPTQQLPSLDPPPPNAPSAMPLASQTVKPPVEEVPPDQPKKRINLKGRNQRRRQGQQHDDSQPASSSTSAASTQPVAHKHPQRHPPQPPPQLQSVKFTTDSIPNAKNHNDLLMMAQIIGKFVERHSTTSERSAQFLSSFLDHISEHFEELAEWRDLGNQVQQASHEADQLRLQILSVAREAQVLV